VDRKVVEVGGKLLTGLPKGCKRRKTIYPARTPAGYPLAEKIAARIEQVRAEMAAGRNPLGLMFPSPRGRHWRSSNLDTRVLAPAYRAAGWRDDHGNGAWTWHSLRLFCVTALFTWHLEAHGVAPSPGTPAPEPPSTCTSAPPPAYSTAPTPPPHNDARHDEEPGSGPGVARHKCRTSIPMNMDRSYEVDRNPSAMVTVTLSCSP